MTAKELLKRIKKGEKWVPVDYQVKRYGPPFEHFSNVVVNDISVGEIEQIEGCIYFNVSKLIDRLPADVMKLIADTMHEMGKEGEGG